MSYILEALRRAQAERDRGQVPRLDAQPLSAGTAVPVARAGGPLRALLLAAALALLALLAALAWLLWRDRGAPRAAPAPDAAAAAITAPPAAPLPIVVSAPPAPVSQAARPPLPPPAETADRAEPAATVLRLGQLSAQQRSALPALTVSGSVWSANPASRFVVVNGQVVHEGQDAAPGVAVLRIGEHAMTVGWRGLRVELPF
ncbi:MAG: general secretion pathway protein GspB [Burkholderiales bacterium]|nr:general secretion pathway protein GspB [Burkholderiales bacterium]